MTTGLNAAMLRESSDDRPRGLRATECFRLAGTAVSIGARPAHSKPWNIQRQNQIHLRELCRFTLTLYRLLELAILVEPRTPTEPGLAARSVLEGG